MALPRAQAKQPPGLLVFQRPAQVSAKFLSAVRQTKLGKRLASLVPTHLLPVVVHPPLASGVPVVRELVAELPRFVRLERLRLEDAAWIAPTPTDALLPPAQRGIARLALIRCRLSGDLAYCT
ncbi:hypothetical protein BV20DRAFT_967363 [Pilatotrama ljubarskyi]|nr:hypothetical protein BV20DRAFT_967363 [Pilatotrama ljubarskyi]